jgi:hypothetical protein
MERMTLAAVAALVLAVAPARADTLPLILDAPATYTPGSSFTFEVRVPGVVDFAAYSIELVFDIAVPNSSLAVTATPDPGQYPFPSLSNFQATPGGVPGSTTLTLSDFTSPGVTTTAGTNDLIAVVSVTPGPGFTGPITISVNPDTLLFDINREQTPSVNPPEPITVEQGAGPPAVVPTPAAWVTLGIGGLILAARRRVLRRVP